MPRFIKAEQGLNNSVIYTDETGEHYRFSGGTWAWRNHNPGNLRPGDISRRHSQIGAVIWNHKKLAVFPDYQTGHMALIDLIKSVYLDYTIDAFVLKYAPPVENDVKKYQNFLHQKTGVKDDKKIRNFTSSEFEKFWQAVEKIEGYKEGTVTEVYQITQVQRNGTGIYAYNVDKKGWVLKEECLKLASQGKIDVVIFHSSLGHPYVRSRPDSSVNDNLSHLVVKKPKKRK